MGRPRRQRSRPGFTPTALNEPPSTSAWLNAPVAATKSLDRVDPPGDAETTPSSPGGATINFGDPGERAGEADMVACAKELTPAMRQSARPVNLQSRKFTSSLRGY